MKETTLCYLIRGNEWLMMLRNKKKNDINANKWIGIGGKTEPNETAEECILREIKEECGLNAVKLDFRGIIDFFYDSDSTDLSERITLYTSTEFNGMLHESDEGTLAWIREDEIENLDLWEGDRIFLRKIMNGDMKPFHLILHYDKEGNLISTAEKEYIQ